MTNQLLRRAAIWHAVSLPTAGWRCPDRTKGVILSVDGGNTWMSEETGLGPAVTIWPSLIRTPAGPKPLFAFTHGRRAWRVTLR